MTSTRRRWIVLGVLLAVAAGVAAWFVPARRSGRGAVAATDGDAARMLRDVRAWDAATRDERRGAAAWVAARTDGFAFDGTEEFGEGAHRHEIAVFTHAATGLEFSLIPGGTFVMGSPEGEAERDPDESQHEVTITRAFLLARTECTQAAYERVMGTNPSAGTVSPDHPVETVSWDDTRAFIAKTGLRLPSEAEWEYACRAGTTTRFWSGDGEDDLARVAWIDASDSGWDDIVNRVRGWVGMTRPATGHHPVAWRPANPFGLWDMHGNVWEWCADGYEAYSTDAVTDPTGAEAAGDRVVRGGSFWDPASVVRSAYRGRLGPGYRNDDLGFRPARSVTSE